MKKMINWVLAATLVCGASVFTACSSDSEDNPAQQEAKRNRKEFVEHTRATLKELALNLNFSSWNVANAYNTNFNKYVLNNPEFEKSVLATFMQKVMESLKPVEEGSELAQMGYQLYATADFTTFNYRFTMNEDFTGFDVEEAEDFEVVLSGWNTQTQQLEKDIYKVTLKSTGAPMTRVVPLSSVEGAALVMQLAPEFQFALSSKVSGAWHDDFSGIMHYQVPEGAMNASQGFTADAIINSDILPETMGNKADKTQLALSINSDRVNGHAGVQLSWQQNGRKMLDLSVKESGRYLGVLSNLDPSQFSSPAALLELIGTILSTRSLDEVKLTLLDDLTTTFRVGNLQQLMLLERQYAAIRRGEGDAQAMDRYVEQMNALVTSEITCKGINQTIPMCVLNTKVGVDNWALYGFNFADENGYVSILDLLDAESVAYAFNIIDHTAEPMQQGALVLAQLIQAAQQFMGSFMQEEE